MILSKYTNRLLSLLILLAVLAGCNKYNKLTEPNQTILGKTLDQVIRETSSLSKFNEYLVKTGYDKVLATSKMYTVWAPDNQALALLDPAIVQTDSLLKQFVGGLIANQAYYTNMPSPQLRVKTLNGKYVFFTQTQLEDAAITTANQYVGNGVLHVINKVVLPKQNVYEYLNTTTSKEKDYVNSLFYTYQDSTLAVKTGLDPQTGKPIYQPGTGMVTKNYLFNRVGDLRNEDQQYTFIQLTDAPLESERTKIRPYVQSSTTAQTDLLSSLHVIKDLVIKGVYTVANMPDTLLSADSVKVPVDKTAILETHIVSNGIVYVMNKLSVPLKNKIRTYKREGEAPDGFSRSDKSGNIAYRYRLNPITNVQYRDIYISNHKVPLFNVLYRIPELYNVPYKVMWVAPNDTQTLTFKQRFAVNDPLSTAFPETQVDLKNYNLVTVGTYTPTAFGGINAYVVAANNGVDQTNSINLDYFILVPQLP